VRLWALVVLLLAARLAPAEEPAGKEDLLLSRLRSRIAALETGLDGILGVCVKDLKTGARIEIRSGEVFPTASCIKVAVLYELYRQADEARVDLNEVTHPPLPRVGGGGVLQVLGGQLALTWRDLAVLMMGWSDNEAANLLIKRVGMDEVNHRLEGLSLKATRLRRLMMDLKAAQRGDENVATPAELVALMEHLYRGTGLSAPRAKDLRSVAEVSKDSPFRLGLPEGVHVADKPGSLEAVRCVCAAVDLPGRPYVAAIMTTYLRRDEDGEVAIREISQALYETFNRLARSSPYGRVISPK